MAIGGLLGLLFGAIGVVVMGILGAVAGDYLEVRQKETWKT